VFLDRDGTLVEDPGFLRDPSAVRLLPGVAEAVRRLNADGWRVIVVTNQSGIARGFISRDEYLGVERIVTGLLAKAGATLDGTYHCPHYPSVSGPCDCRKPGTLLYRRAAADFKLDLGQCWWIGDRLTDLAPALEFGGRATLIGAGEGTADAMTARERGFGVAVDLAEASLVLSPES
jgi:histidinol-phosphate phosphatase family protein